jgi:hypothetical protein
MDSSRNLIHDERGLITGWFGKLLIGFALVGVLIYDGGSIVVNLFTLDSRADEIAIELTTGASPGTLTLATIEPRARELAKESGARLSSLRVENNIVYVELKRKASTLVVGRISFLEDWTRSTAQGQAGVI